MLESLITTTTIIKERLTCSSWLSVTHLRQIMYDLHTLVPHNHRVVYTSIIPILGKKWYKLTNYSQSHTVSGGVQPQSRSTEKWII